MTAPPDPPTPAPGYDITPVTIEDEMQRSYLDYAMSVIVSRALPDARDGLKPVHRRIIYSMKENGYDAGKPYRKSARIVGDVMGKYHPHGDTAIYDAMVRMAQVFSMRLPLIDGQGNFGSMDGDRPAAMRYTEARLARSAHALIEDIDKDTVDFQSNYDETVQEPVVLPAQFPNLLVNGGGGIAALRVPQEGIVDYPAVCSELKRRITANGGDVQTGARVTRLKQRGGEWIATTPKGEFAGRYLVNCAGLHCDRVAGLAGEKRETRIVPFRGEYYKLVEGSEGLVRHLIYPVPDPQFPFLGVHFTRLIHGGIAAGPNAVLAFAREGYRKTDVNVRDLWDAVTYSGLWRFVVKYPRMTALELWQSLSKRRFCKALQKLVPIIRVTDIEPGGAGVRAQAMAREGNLIQDFCLIQRPAALHVLNAPSPAATASLAIGEEIVRKILETK